MISAVPESRATGPLTSMFPVISLIFHVPVTVYARVMVLRLDSSLRHYDVFPYHAYPLSGLDFLCHDDVGMTSTLFLLPVPDTTSLLPGSLSLCVTYPTGRYFCISPLRPLRLFVLVSP